MKNNKSAYWIIHFAWWALYSGILLLVSLPEVSSKLSLPLLQLFPAISNINNLLFIFIAGSAVSAIVVLIFKAANIPNWSIIEAILLLFMFQICMNVADISLIEKYRGPVTFIKYIGMTGLQVSFLIAIVFPFLTKQKKTKSYDWCQIGGWSAYVLIWIFFYHAIRTRTTPYFYENIFLDSSLGLLLTHLMRTLAKSLKLFQFSIRQQIVAIVLISFGFALIDGIILTFLQNMEGIIDLKYTFWNRSIRASFSSVLILLIWNLIYFMYHYILKTRQEQFDKIRLESLVKELELKTIKAHINPHFIFNALNSIRALVDENPVRARTAITELSNILRSSMQAEKAETSPLEKELNIVKDYLALEHIRFEDRLRVEYDIDEDTLDQPVPPMMLQTLVENAIKHGISKQKDGGLVKVISDFRNNHHELIIQNTGQLNGTYNIDGFGIASTQNRLALLFGNKAHFELKDINGNMVEAKVIMPVSV